MPSSTSVRSERAQMAMRPMAPEVGGISKGRWWCRVLYNTVTGPASLPCPVLPCVLRILMAEAKKGLQWRPPFGWGWGWGWAGGRTGGGADCDSLARLRPRAPCVRETSEKSRRKCNSTEEGVNVNDGLEEEASQGQSAVSEPCLSIVFCLMRRQR